jgi:hypothetical protein
MKPEATKNLQDVLECIDELKTVSDKIKNLQHVKDDVQLHENIEREFEIIEDILNRCVIEEPERELKTKTETTSNSLEFTIKVWLTGILLVALWGGLSGSRYNSVNFGIFGISVIVGFFYSIHFPVLFYFAVKFINKKTQNSVIKKTFLVFIAVTIVFITMLCFGISISSIFSAWMGPYSVVIGAAIIFYKLKTNITKTVELYPLLNPNNNQEERVVEFYKEKDMWGMPKSNGFLL